MRIQARQIPTQWRSLETTWKLGRIFNKCHKAVIPKHGSKEGKYAKLLVEVDLMKPLIQGTKLRCNMDSRWIEFKYKNIPLFCFYCGEVCHGDRVCDKKNEDSQTSVLQVYQFGEWMRVGYGRGFNKNWNWGRREGGCKCLGILRI